MEMTPSAGATVMGTTTSSPGPTSDRAGTLTVLTAIFHVRAPYPEEPRRRGRSDADLRREST